MWSGNVSQSIFGILVVAIIVFYVYESFVTPPSQLENYENFSRELQRDMDRYGIDDQDQKRIELIVEKIVDKKKKEKNVKNLVNACKTGLVRGCLVGFMSGGISGAITSGATYGVINSFMHGLFE